MRVVLARRHSTAGGPPAVHAYWLPDDETASAAWWAPCGDRITPDSAEVVEQFTGAPCNRCWMLAALGSGAAPVGRGELADAPLEPAAGPGSAPGAEWAASWSVRAVHAVEVGAPRTNLDGRSVVFALCGELGWGPMDPPPGWPLCDECAAIAGART